jgi:uncharacterized protein YebE (UPF0316 family)
MDLGFNGSTILTGILVFCARVADVTMGTLRTISIVQGRSKSAFILGFLEITLWLAVISAIISKIYQKPILGIFYALGFSTGSVVGILIEKRLALGHVVLRVISTEQGGKMARKIRKMGFGVTTFEGRGKSGPVMLLYIVCGRKDLKSILNTVKEIEANAFYITEQVRVFGKILRPMMLEPTGWRAVFKKK